MKTTLCKSCGAEILWAESEVKGKWVPLSVATREKRLVLPPYGRGTPICAAADTYLAHFVDCPDAAAFRREVPE